MPRKTLEGVDSFRYGIKPTATVTHFPVTPDGVYWFRVLIFPTTRYMRWSITRHVKETHRQEVGDDGALMKNIRNGSSRSVLAFTHCWHLHEPVKSGFREVKQLGQIIFSRQSIDAPSVAHELVHAALWWLSVRWEKDNSTTPAHQLEEEICEAVDRMFQQVINALRGRAGDAPPALVVGCDLALESVG